MIALLIAAAGAWSHAASVRIPPVPRPAYVRLVLPQSIDGGDGAAYADVRIADAQDRETPYALDATPAVSASAAVALSDVGFVTGRYTQAIADLGTSGQLHSAIALESSQPTFFEHVQIATSDDRENWAVVVPKALIYRVAQNADDGESTIAFGPSRARWVRIRVLDPSRAFPITGASVPAVATPPRLVPLSGSIAVHAGAGTTTITIDFGTPNTNLGAVAFETRTAQFSRGVAFATDDGARSDDGPAWQDAGNATISRYANGRPQLEASLGNLYAQRLRATIDDGNDPPLASLTVTPLGYQHALIFAALPGQTYRLLWGNAAAAAPVYDLADRLAHQSWSVAATATLGGGAPTAFVPAATSAPVQPWLQRAALPLALALAFVVLIAISLRALRTSPPEA
ncbi:MAG TPA: DUF3999 family protein [Verrucomicrobiae bacterium]|nr:DUF3999 family protein [Verrucomicrobiae bacterium]